MEKLKELRLKANVSQQVMADFLGVSRPAYTMYEIGKREPSHETLQKLADYFGVSVDYLLGRTENPLPETKKEATEITFDDFTYAFYNESKNLSEEQKAALLNMAKLFNEQLNKEE